MRGRSLLIAITLAAGLAGGCPTVDLGDAPPDPGTCRPDFVYYRDVIWPEYLAPADTSKSCVSQTGCHDAANGRSSFRLDTQDPIDQMTNYQTVTRFLNCGSPDSSALLTKPLSGLDSHGGGDLFDPGSQSEMTFLTWFEQ